MVFVSHDDSNFSHVQGQLMDITMLIADNSYMLNCWKSRTNPTLILDSSIFEDT